MKTRMKMNGVAVRSTIVALGWFAAAVPACGGSGGDDGGQVTGPSAGANQAPSAEITNPEPGANVQAGVSVVFEGSARDSEDGELTGDALTWESDRHGRIGTGTTFTRDDLSEGRHRITLTARDSQGASDDDAIFISVGPETDPATVGRIVFNGRDPDDPTVMWMMNGDGSDKQSVGDGCCRTVGHDLSPDGNQIVYYRSEEQGEPPEILVYDLASGTKTQLTDNSSRDNKPRWSPDGRQILFWSNRTGSGEVFVMDADGNGVTQLTDDPDVENLEGDWSPDGGRIVFRSTRGDGGGGDLWIMNADGTNPTQLTATPNTQDFNPVWSPDEETIAFERLESNDFGIMLIQADGSGRRVLFDSPDRDEVPTWSPEGTAVAFESRRPGLDADIFVIDVDGSELTKVAASDAPEGVPTWGPAPQ